MGIKREKKVCTSIGLGHMAYCAWRSVEPLTHLIVLDLEDRLLRLGEGRSRGEGMMNTGMTDKGVAGTSWI